jgi:K+-sensing histidine kinase KdpD
MPANVSSRSAWLIRYGAAVAATGVGLLVRWALEAWVGPGLPTFITFYPAVMAVALLAGFGPGLVATAAAALVADYWIISPLHAFAVEKPVDGVALVFFSGMGLFMYAVLDQALRNLRAGIESARATITHDPLPILSVDATQMMQLFQNLIGNALKFHGERPLQIHIGARTEEARWVFRVQDNGIGIDPQYFERMFQVFQRLHTRRKYPGTGIGLATCKKIVERHGGKIWVESQPGQGSTFYFSIPEAKSM